MPINYVNGHTVWVCLVNERVCYCVVIDIAILLWPISISSYFSDKKSTTLKDSRPLNIFPALPLCRKDSCIP